MAEFAGKTRVVFVGNLPYDCTEQEVQKVFEVAGPVASFRHVFDRDTNRAKGFGFCEYFDTATAASAVRNLNGIAEVRGRALRVDFAQPDIKDLPKDQRGAAKDSAGLPPLPPGVILPPGVNPADKANQTLQAMPPGQLLDVLHQIKGLIITSPDKARLLLSGNPQLCYAIFQAMLMLNLVDPAVIHRLIVPGSNGAGSVQTPQTAAQVGYNTGGPPQGGPGPYPGQGPPHQQGPPGGGPPMPPQQQRPPYGNQGGYGGPPPQQQQQGGYGGPAQPPAFQQPPPQQQGGYTNYQPPQDPRQQQQQANAYRQGGPPPAPGSFPMPPQANANPFGAPPNSGGGFPMPPQQQQQGGYGTPPPHMQQQQQQQQMVPGANPQQTALLQQVLAMSQQQVDALPAEQRQTVMAIRASAGR